MRYNPPVIQLLWHHNDVTSVSLNTTTVKTIYRTLTSCMMYHQSVLPKGRSFTALRTNAAVLPKGRSSTANSGTKVAILLLMNRCDSFPLLSAPHSLFAIRKHIKRSEKIPGAPTWKWRKWIWLTGHAGLHRNSSYFLLLRAFPLFSGYPLFPYACHFSPLHPPPAPPSSAIFQISMVF